MIARYDYGGFYGYYYLEFRGLVSLSVSTEKKICTRCYWTQTLVTTWYHKNTKSSPLSVLQAMES